MKKTASLAILAIALSFPGWAEIARAEIDTREVVHASNGTIVTNSWGTCVRTKWSAGGDACAPAVAEQTVEQTVTRPRRRTEIAQEQRTIYFAFNKSELTAESKAKLDSLAQVLRSADDVRDAKIVGYADRIGSVSYNDKLSKARAETVKNYIVAHGYANTSVAETRWLGKTAPITSCPATLKRPQLIQCLQADRRVEVELEYVEEVASNQ